MLIYNRPDLLLPLIKGCSRFPAGSVTAQCERPLVPARQKPTRVLTNQKATSHLRQSGRLGVRHVKAAKYIFYAQHCEQRTPLCYTVQGGCIFPITFSISLICFWPSCHFALEGWGPRRGWGLFLEHTESPQFPYVQAKQLPHLTSLRSNVPK